MTPTDAFDLVRLFPSFVIDDLAPLYAARDRAAALAASALTERRPEPVRDLQALLRASVAIALTSNLPTAMFIESGLLWGAKLDAVHRLYAAKEPSALTSPFSGVSFDMFSYTVDDYEDTLIAAAALPCFRGDATDHFEVSLRLAREARMDALRAWAQCMTAQILVEQLAAFVECGGWATPGNVGPIQAEIAAASTGSEPTQGRVGPRSHNPPTEAAALNALYEVAAMISGNGPHYQSVQPDTPLYYMMSHDEVLRSSGGQLGTLSYKAVILSMAGQPAPDPDRAPVAAVVHAASSRSQSGKIHDVVRRAAARVASARHSDTLELG